MPTPPEPYPLATQAKVEPSSIRSTANFVKTVDSVPRGVLQRASLVGRAVLVAPQPGLAPLGNPGEPPSRLAASGSHMLPAAQPELVLAEVVALAARQWAAQVCANSSSWLLAGMG